MNIYKIPLFQRAKCALCGKTVLGNVVERLYDSEQFWFRTNTGKLTLVNVESVCNWTGKYDSYHTQIFEGDVLELTCELDGESFCERLVVAYNKIYAAYCLFNKHGRFDEPGLDILSSEDIRVVGNIYDNPELVEGWEDSEGDSL